MNFSGDRQIGRGSGAITLDAVSVTLDPDQTNDPFACSWRCEVASGGAGFCYSAVERGKLIFESISGCDTTVQSSQFEAGKSYKIMYVLKREWINQLVALLLTHGRSRGEGVCNR